jgi:hypothetical protein
MTYQMRRAKGSYKPVVDTPLSHGWVLLRKSETDGAPIYDYKGAEVRRSFDNPWDVWIGNVNGHGFEFDTRRGTLAEMTAFIEAELSAIPFNGEPIQNNAPETGRESIGLEAR